MAYLKSDAMIFTKQTALSPESGHLSEIPCIVVTQEVAKPLEVKFEGFIALVCQLSF